MNLDCLLISAGKSSRMGRPKEKLLYENKPFIINIIEKTLTVCKNIYVVVNNANKLEIEELISNYIGVENNNKIKVVLNEEENSPMLVSIQKGLSNIAADTEWILLHLVDQPLLPESFYYEFTSGLKDGYDWIQPLYKERKGHPILINSKIFSNIKNLSNVSSLKEISSNPSIKKKYIELGYKDILTDIDTPEDYSSKITNC